MGLQVQSPLWGEGKGGRRGRGRFFVVVVSFCFVESSRDDSGFLSPTACSLSRAAKESIGTRQEAERMSGKHGQEPLPLQKVKQLAQRLPGEIPAKGQGRAGQVNGSAKQEGL